jgi:hypothetical protein
MSLRRQAIKLAASLPKGAERTAILNSISAADKEAGCEKLPAGKMRENCESGGPIGKKKDDKSDDKKDDKAEAKDDKKDDKKKDDGKMPADLLEKFKGKKASRNILASFQGADAKLAREVVKLASRLPQQRTILLDTLRQAAGEEDATVNAPGGGFDPTEISEVEKGGPLEQETDEPYMKDEFTQQEFHELGDKQESGDLAKGTDEQKKYAKVAAAKTAATKKFRGSLIRIASELPKGSRARQDMLHLLAS